MFIHDSALRPRTRESLNAISTLKSAFPFSTLIRVEGDTCSFSDRSAADISNGSINISRIKTPGCTGSTRLIIPSSEAYISFKFDANEGDIISFDSKINLGVEDKFWGNIFCEIDGERRNLDKSIFFINNKIQINDSGSHTLKFGITNYNDNYTDEIYAYFKNIRILTLITNSDALDETKLSGGEKILYEGITSTGNFVSNSMLSFSLKINSSLLLSSSS